MVNLQTAQMIISRVVEDRPGMYFLSCMRAEISSVIPILIPASGVIFDVVPDATQVVFVADYVLVIIALPDRGCVGAAPFIDPACRE